MKFIYWLLGFPPISFADKQQLAQRLAKAGFPKIRVAANGSVHRSLKQLLRSPVFQSLLQETQVVTRPLP